MGIVLVAAATFLLCWLLDKGFQKAFRSAPQHMSGKSVRLNKYNGLAGVILTLLGIVSMLFGGEMLLLVGGGIVLLMGIALIVYYLSFGIYYDEETFLVSSLGKKTKARRYEDIREQKLYVIQGGSALVELHMTDGSTLSVQTTMEGASAFLDYAFARWCEQKGLDSDDCDFHDPSSLQWFPAVEEQ